MCIPRPTNGLLCFLSTIVFAACSILTSGTEEAVTILVAEPAVLHSEVGSRMVMTLAVVIANDG